MSEQYHSVDDLANVFAASPGASQPDAEQDDNTAKVSTESDEAEALEGETDSDETPDEEEGGPSSEDDADQDTDVAEEDDADAEFDGDQLIPVAGQDEKVPLKELQAGYLRQRDYTRKTQELAEERKASRADYEAVKAERAQYAQLLPALKVQLMSEYTDLEALRETDFVAYSKKKEDMERKASAFHAEEQRIAWEQQRASQEAFQAELSNQFTTLFDKRPEWKDETTWNRVRKDILTFGESYGYSQEELANATDHRAILALARLMELEKSLNKTSKQVQANTPAKKTIPVASKNQTPRKKTELQRASERLSNPNKPGKVSDLAAFFSALDNQK